MDTRERILEAARALFSEKGYGATSTREIATRAGCNLSLISHYFGGKEGLLRALLVAGFELIHGELRALQKSDAPFEERIGRFIDFVIDTFAANPQLMQIVHREVMQAHDSALRDEFLPRIAMNVQLLRSMLEDAAGRGELADVDPKLAAAMLFGMLHSYFTAYPLSSKVIGPATPRLVAALKLHAKRIFLRGVTR